jgi:hypothetical protein
MKWKKEIVLTVVVLLAVLLTSAGSTGAQGGSPTVVSYQGQVTVDGSPYAGPTGHFKFAVVNAAGDTTYWSNDGTASGEPVNAVALTVSNGLFNVLLGDTSLDNMTALPATAFDGTERYLRVWFSSDGSSFDLLSPDRRIAAVPYALQAEEAAYAAAAGYATGAGDADTLDGQHASAFVLAGATWNLTGNAGTVPGTDFVGTTDNQALEVKVNNSRALRLEPGTSPNLLGGYSGNWVAPGVFGAVIGGGGQGDNLNRVVDHVGVVGGGQNNQAGSDDGTVGNHTLATVAGGANNTASGTVSAIGGGSTNSASGYISTIAGGRGNATSGSYAAIGGGWNNQVTGNYAFVGGGYDNDASGPGYGYSTVAGGFQNIASGDISFIGAGAYNKVYGGIYNAISAGASNLITTTNWANFIGGGYGNVITGTVGYSTIGGGRQNRITNSYVTVAGGRGNTASGGYATVAGGQDNTASGSWAVAGGRANTVSGSYATVPGGVYAAATHFGEMAYASGGFAVAGDAQASAYVLRREYAMAAGTWHDLFLDGNGASQRLTIAAGRTVTFDILISGRTAAGESAGYRIQGVVENYDGITALVGTPTVTVLGEDDAAWNVQVLASDALDALLPQVQGNGETIRWVATVNTSEVSW